MSLATIIEDFLCSLIHSSSTGKALYVPKIVDTKESKMDMLRIYNQEDLASLPSGTWGIKEPGPTWEGRRRGSGSSELESPKDHSNISVVLTSIHMYSPYRQLGRN